MRIAGKTNITAGLAPFDSADTFETHSAIYGKGGWRTVATIEERDAIPYQRREELMIVSVIADGKAYQLVGGIANTDWQLFSGGGGGSKVMVFVFPGVVKLGVQRIELGFPFIGQLLDISASLIDFGTTDTVVQLQKISCVDYLAGLDTWVDCLQTPLLIEAGKKSSINSTNSIVFTHSTVAAKDYFRLVVVAAGESASDMTVEVVVDL